MTNFRATSIETKNLVVSGATNSEILKVYPLSKTAPSAGTDVFVFVSGSDTRKTVFGGDVHISGNLAIDGSDTSYWTSPSNGIVYTSGSVSASGIQFAPQASDPTSFPSSSLYMDNGTNYQAGTLVWKNKMVIDGETSIGGPGFEQSSIQYVGGTFNAHFKVNDIGGSVDALQVFHRHSTTDGANIAFTRANSDNATHAALANNSLISNLIFAGHDGTDYNPAAIMSVYVDGVVADNVMPGKFVFAVSPSGSNTPATALTIAQDKSLFADGQVYVSGSIQAKSNLFVTGVLQVTGATKLHEPLSVYPLTPGFTEPSVDAGSGGSGAVAIPYGSSYDIRNADNSDWIYAATITDDVGFAQAGQKNLYYQGGSGVSVMAFGVGNYSFAYDPVTGSWLQSLGGLGISSEQLDRASSHGTDTYFFVSGAVGQRSGSNATIATFGGDLHSSGNITFGDGAVANIERLIRKVATTGSETITGLTYTLTSSQVFDFDFTIIAAGTGSGITKRFKRNVSCFGYDTSGIMQSTVFETVPDVSGSSSANYDIGFTVTGSNLVLKLTGSTGGYGANWLIVGNVSRIAGV